MRSIIRKRRLSKFSQLSFKVFLQVNFTTEVISSLTHFLHEEWIDFREDVTVLSKVYYPHILVINSETNEQNIVHQRRHILSLLFSSKNWDRLRNNLKYSKSVRFSFHQFFFFKFFQSLFPDLISRTSSSLIVSLQNAQIVVRKILFNCISRRQLNRNIGGALEKVQPLNTVS